MATYHVQFELPDALAREAEAAGLALTGESITGLIREEIRRRRVDRLFEHMDRLASLPGEPMSADEIEAEIESVRQERRPHDASGR
jgi:hypothetical protein